MAEIAEFLVARIPHLVFLFIFGSYILAYKAGNPTWISPLVNVPMMLAFAINSFLILKEPVLALASPAVRNSLSNEGLLTLSLIILMFGLMMATAIVINFQHNPPKGQKPAPPAKPKGTESPED